MIEIKNILVTGDINIGKSTLINQVIEKLDLKVNGFRTLPYYIDKKRIGFYIEDIHDPLKTSKDRQKEQMIGEIIGYKKVKPFDQTFNTTGVKVLEESLNQNGIILMDELGIIESNSLPFQQMVMACLDSDKLVICSIRDDQSQFLDAVRNHEKSILFSINEKNRDEIFESVMEFMIKLLNLGGESC